MYYTPVPINPFESKITYNDNILLLGSCFSENIAHKLEYYKFKTLSNPLGTLFNPASIELLINKIVQKQWVSEKDFFCDDDVYKSFYFHSSIAGTNLSVIIEKANNLIAYSNEFLKQATFIFITLGSAFVFEHKELGIVVANCHKQPANRFVQRRLSIDESIYYLETIIKHIRTINQQSNIIFTVSPVRYLKYGSFQNQLSKATLLLAIEKVLNEKQNIFYFPAYEIFIDELRDYRFYDNDLIHPSSLGIQHIWERFKQTFFTDETLQWMKKIEQIQQAIHHRPMFKESKSYSLFRENIEREINNIRTQFPFITFDEFDK